MNTEQPWALLEELDSMVVGGWATDSERKAAAELRRLHAENEALRGALEDAATSLETIDRLAGKSTCLGDNGERIPTYMEHHDEVRGYAKSRASVARAALTREGETK